MTTSATDTRATSAHSRRIYYGWLIVAVSTLALVVSNGLTIGGIPVFYKPIQEDLVASGALTLRQKDAMTGLAAGLTFLVAGLFSPLAGILIQKFRLRWLMAAGCVILGLALLLYTRATAPLHVYAAHTMFGVALGFVGVMVNTVLISNWFRRQRGAAMGIVLTGTSFGGALIPLVSTPLIALYGWRTAMLAVSALVWLVLLPAILLLVRDRPREKGVGPDGDPLTEDKTAGTATLPGMTLGEALRTPLFWVFGACAALIFYPIFTVSQQLILHLQSPAIGLSRAEAGFAQSALFVTSVGGKFLFGWLSDKLPATRVLLVCCAVMFLSTLMLLGFLSAGTVFVFLVPFGLGYGGTFVLVQLLAVESFGLRDIGKILGAITVIETFGGFVGSVVTGRLAAAANGDYTVALYGVTLAAGCALLMAFGVNLLTNRKAKIV